MKKNLLKLAMLAATLTVAIGCTKQDELLITDDSQQATEEGIARSAVAKIDYIASDFTTNQHWSNLLTCDKYGNAYYVSGYLYSEETKVVKVDNSTLQTSTLVDRVNFPEVGYPEGIAVDGNGDLFVVKNRSIRKYNTSGTSASVDYTSAVTSKSLMGGIKLCGITVDINDHIYIYNSAVKSELFRITKAGAVQLLSSNEPIWLQYGGLFKGRGANIFVDKHMSSNATTYAHTYTNGNPFTERVSPLPFNGMGAGMDNGFVYLLSGYTIQRVNPNNGAIRQLAELPQNLEIGGEVVALKMPSRIAPTPDATAFYVAYPDGYLFKVTL